MALTDTIHVIMLIPNYVFFAYTILQINSMNDQLCIIKLKGKLYIFKYMTVQSDQLTDPLCNQLRTTIYTFKYTILLLMY